jgi:hypothetical protein
MRVHNDHDRAARALYYLRGSYPTSDVILIDDGTGAPELDALAAKFKAKLYRGERQYAPKNCGNLWHEALTLYLENSTAEYLCKIDSDTIVLRPFKRLFPKKAIFGDTMSNPKFVQGGFMGMPREGAQKLITDKTLLGDNYNTDWIVLKIGDRIYISEDRCVSDAMRGAGFIPTQYDEIGNAVVHPCKCPVRSEA